MVCPLALVENVMLKGVLLGIHADRVTEEMRKQEPSLAGMDIIVSLNLMCRVHPMEILYSTQGATLEACIYDVLKHLVLDNLTCAQEEMVRQAAKPDGSDDPEETIH